MAQATNVKSALEAAAGYVNAEGGYPDAEAGALRRVRHRGRNDRRRSEHTAALRAFTHKTARFETVATDASEKTPYETYYDFSEPARRIPNHRVLAIDRGEKEGKLRVRVRTDADTAIDLLGRRIVRRRGPFAESLDAAIADGYKRLMAPSLERELRSELTERAQTDAIAVFAKDTESLLSQRPVKGARIIALDPGYRTGCKMAVLDEFGTLLDHGTVYPTPPRRDVEGTKRTLERMVSRHRINTIVIGNGTASRETEEVVSQFIAESSTDLRYTIVNEAGASVYSASKLASEEYPDLDVTTRGAMSLGRRLQDPLAELVKIPVQSIGVGQYQHDLDQAELGCALAGVVERTVNRVGVDLNTASASLLGYVSGITPAHEHGRLRRWAFTDRQLKKVARLGRRRIRTVRAFYASQAATTRLTQRASIPAIDRPSAARTRGREGRRTGKRRHQGNRRAHRRHRGPGIRVGMRRPHPARHRGRAGKAGTRPARRRARNGVQHLRARFR